MVVHCLCLCHQHSSQRSFNPIIFSILFLAFLSTKTKKKLTTEEIQRSLTEAVSLLKPPKNIIIIITIIDLFFFVLFLVFLYPKIPNRGHNKTDTMNQTSPFQQCQHVGEENQHQSTSSFQLCWELQNQKWSFQGLKCKFWTKLLANIAQAILKKTADQVGVLINGVIDHFARKVKEDGELVIVSSVERSAWHWNNNYETENNPNEVCKEENYCSA